MVEPNPTWSRMVRAATIGALFGLGEQIPNLFDSFDPANLLTKVAWYSLAASLAEFASFQVANGRKRAAIYALSFGIAYITIMVISDWATGKLFAPGPPISWLVVFGLGVPIHSVLGLAVYATSRFIEKIESTQKC